MIIKNKKKNTFFYAFILVISFAYFAFLLSTDGKFINRFVHDQKYKFYDYVLSMNLGFSSISAITSNPNDKFKRWGDTSFFDRVILGYAAGLAKKIPEIFLKKIQGFPSRPPLELIYIDINFKNYQKLLEDRENAMQLKLLFKHNKVKAKIRHKNKTFNAKIRLKGDLYDHWRSSRSMSLRVEINGKNSIFGLTKFSLHKPEARQFPYDHVFQRLIRRIGNISPIHKYAHIFVNGESWGIMNLEEHMSKELLEKQGKKDSIIVKFGDEKIWHYRRMSNSYKHYRLSDENLSVKLYSKNKYLKSKVYRGWLTYLAENRLRHKNNAELYDVDSYARAFILTSIWSNFHGISNTNTRHYFNPYLLKLEPITTDQGRFKKSKVDSALARHFPSGIIGEIVKTKKFGAHLSNNYRAILNVLKNIEDEFTDVQRFFPVDNEINTDVINNNIAKLSELPGKGFSGYVLKKSDNKFIDALPSDEQAKDFPQHLIVRHYEDGLLKIFNLLPDTVKLEKLVVDGNAVINLNLKVPGYLPDSYDPYNYQTNLRGIHDNRITVETIYRGNHRTHVIGPTLLQGVRNPLLLSEMKSNHKFVNNIGKSDWRISRGIWNVNEPIVVHGDLIIEEGTELYFSDKAYLIVLGAIHAKGTASAKIILAPQNNSWKGLYVIGDGGMSSELSKVVIRSTSGLEDGMLDLTGGVTFYNSDLLLEDVRFEKSYAEDALNLVGSKYIFKKVYFNETRSDAFDSDFSSGKIVDSVINDIGGDALDFSGSICDIENITISDVQDKAVSVGEQSVVTLSAVQIDTVGVGIASKDGSRVTVSDSSIRNYTLHAGMTYSKKGFYDGKSRIKMFDTEIYGDHPFAVQVETHLTIDGVEVAAENIDVQELYQSDEMRK